MPLRSKNVGRTGAQITNAIDARWTMAYAAGLGDQSPRYLDTNDSSSVVAHPLFPVCFEWGVFTTPEAQPGRDGLSPEEQLRGVHATHDVILHRSIRPGDVLETVATLAGVERRKPGAYQLLRIETGDASGAPVCTTWYGSLLRGVDVEGPDAPASELPEQIPAPAPVGSVREGAREYPVAIEATAAHVYTECARIWNPIHTDPEVARKAGLPAIILHGTATLAHAVSQIVAHELAGDPERVARIAGRFASMVLMPSTLRVRVLSRHPQGGGEAIHFDVLTEDGKPAIRDGLVCVGSRS